MSLLKERFSQKSEIEIIEENETEFLNEEQDFEQTSAPSKKSKAFKIGEQTLKTLEKLKSNKKTFNKITESKVKAGFTCTVVNVIMLLIMYIVAFVKVNPKVFTINPIYIIIATAIPIITWFYSTDYEYWNYRQRKIFTLTLVITNAILVNTQIVYAVLYPIIVKKAVGKLKPNPALTPDMILNLARLLMGVGVVGFIIIIILQIKPLIYTDINLKRISRFKLNHIWDRRDNKEHLYDLPIAKDIKSGKPILIKENDRFVHMFIDGASGTGKTSSIFTPSILNDLNIKVKNREKRQQEILSMLKSNKAYVKGPYLEFKEEYIVAKEGYEAELQEIKKKYPDCGMTVMAPNNSVIEDVIKLCAARGINVNIIDPERVYTEYPTAKSACLNPLYVTPGLPMEERVIQISKNASVFAEVLVAANEANGSSDQYFRDINTSATSNISMVCMLAKNIQNKQATVNDVQRCINKFSELGSMIKLIKAYFFIETQQENTNNTLNSKKGKYTQVDDNIDISNIIDKQNADTDKSYKEKNTSNQTTWTGSTDEEFIQKIINERANLTENEKQERIAEGEAYRETINFIENELLGAGAEKMYDQARGLRNLINKLLLDPRIKKMLNATDENRLDLDGILKNNEITCVNTALSFGQESSTAFGLFFLLSYKISVLRRPMNTRSNHFIYIDEASQWMHNAYEEFISLFRQFRVGCTFAVQSLSQTEKNDRTKFLKDVFLGAGTLIAFGRVSPDEMKLYSEMAGAREELTPQKTTSHSSLLAETPSSSTSVRTTPNMKAVLEGSDIRMQDFQEITIFTIDNGRVVEGKIGKVSFVKKTDFNKVKYTEINWEPYIIEDEEQKNKMKPQFKAEETKKEKELENVLVEEILDKNMTQYMHNAEEPEDIEEDDTLIDFELLYEETMSSDNFP